MSARWMVALAATTGLALAGVTTWALSLSRALDEADREATESSLSAAQMSAELRAARSDAELLVDVLAVVDEPGLRLVEFDDHSGSGAWGRALVGGRGLVLLVRGLPEPRTAHEYQVWIETTSSGLTSGGRFDVNPFGMATAVFPAIVPPGGRLLVTEEPVGGSVRPTNPPVLEGS